MNDKYKHRTPAPWTAYDRGIGWEIHDATGAPINSGFRDTFSRADAELCAAAPELLAENERLRNRVAELEQLATDAYLQFDGAAIARLRARVASLEAGYREAVDDMQDACSASSPRDQERYQLQTEVDAHRAVLSGVIESVAGYKAYLPQQQIDGGQS